MNAPERSPGVDPLLLRARTRTVYVELTSRCNARCVYCPVSQPDYAGEDLELDVESLAALLERLDPTEVQISGHGETTLLEHWTHVARTLLGRGLPLTLTSNFAKRFELDEIDVLTRFRALKISVDSADAVVHERLRRGVRLARIEENIRSVLRRCRESFREPPYLHIGCTVTDHNIGGLCELVRWTVAQEAHCLSLVNLVRHPDVAGATPIRHPAEVDPAGALRRIEEATRLARELGLRFTLGPGTLDALQEAQRCR